MDTDERGEYRCSNDLKATSFKLCLLIKFGVTEVQIKRFMN